MTDVKSRLREASKSSPVKGIPSGVDLMRQINEGTLETVPSAYLQEVKAKITEGCDELIELGARIRPLMVDGKQLGWVRGVHNTERRRISRWVHDPNDYILSILSLATTLSKNTLEQFNSMEIRHLIRLVQSMTECDVSLYPYLSAFTGTLSSENLWHGRGLQLTSFENKEIHLPDGEVMRVLAPSEHARLWATLCVYREQAKVRLDANWNAVLQVRPLAGKSVDPLANELKALSKQLATDSLIPWESVVRYKDTTNLDDGWAHPENLETTEGMLKELHGMMSNDKHEQAMALFEKNQLEAVEARNRAIAAANPNRSLGINEETLFVVTDAEMRKQEMDLKKGRNTPVPINREKTELVVDPLSRMKRYQ